MLSDLDDTLLCSGVIILLVWTRDGLGKLIYPGVLAFYRELDLGTDEGDFRSRLGNYRICRRDHTFFHLAERSSTPSSAHLLQAKRLHTMPTLLTDNSKTGGEMMWGDMEPRPEEGPELPRIPGPVPRVRFYILSATTGRATRGPRS